MSQLTCICKKILLIICMVIGLQTILQAQDPYFSQFFMNPVYMNPAYAGTMKVPRAGVQYRNQWPAMDKAYITYFASFDTYLPKISSGIGVVLYNDVQGDGLYTETSFKFIYSKEIRLSSDWTMYGSITAGTQINSLNWNQLIFSDELDPVYGLTLPTNEISPDSNNRISPDFGTGILLYNGKYFFGLAVDHLSEPNKSVYSSYSSILSRKYTAHFEFSVPYYEQGHWRKFCTFTPNFIIQSQGSEQNMTYGVYANRKGVSVGLWNRITTQKSSDMIVMAGFMGKQMKTAITYDVNFKGVGLRSHGSVEISVSFLLKNPGKKSIFPYYGMPGEWDIR
jgi:type IX secretion system PorP/SprF family membrane protein